VQLTPGRLPWVTLWITVAAAVIQRRPELGDALALVPERVRDGEPWRLLSGHLVHWNRAHAVGDIAAFAVWASAIEVKDRKLLAWLLLGAGLVVSALILVAYPELSEYRGLSAIDCALAATLMALGLSDERLRRRPVLHGGVALCAVGLFMKTVFEFARRHAILAPDLGRRVALLPGAHAFGIAAGLAALVAWRSTARQRAPGRE
jgi:rhomboid family GlyGly-CTERM serine protease